MRRKRDWPWWKVKAALEARGTTLSAVARDNGFDVSSATKVKRIPIPNLQALIAAAIGERPQEIWPTRYDRRGKPVRTYTWVKNNTPYRMRNVQKREAA